MSACGGRFKLAHAAAALPSSVRLGSSLYIPRLFSFEFLAENKFMMSGLRQRQVGRRLIILLLKVVDFMLLFLTS